MIKQNLRRKLSKGKMKAQVFLYSLHCRIPEIRSIVAYGFIRTIGWKMNQKILGGPNSWWLGQLFGFGFWVWNVPYLSLAKCSGLWSTYINISSVYWLNKLQRLKQRWKNETKIRLHVIISSGASWFTSMFSGHKANTALAVSWVSWCLLLGRHS